jgi:LemA protein
MNPSELRIPEDMVPEVLALASQYYADQTQAYSVSELVEAGSEIHLPAELIEQAIAEVRARRLQQIVQRRQRRKWYWFILKLSTGILVVGMCWSLLTYNAILNQAAAVDARWAQVENQLQRRSDLIPNLVRVTQAYAEHEQALISLLVRSNDAYSQATTLDEKLTAMAAVNAAMQQFLSYAETHPSLQSNQLFINLQYEIVGTENRLAVERMRYNQAVQIYNQTIQKFPNLLMARALGFQHKPFAQATLGNP